MLKFAIILLALAFPATANAAGGCGAGFHRDYNGGCVPNVGYGVPYVGGPGYIGRPYVGAPYARGAARGYARGVYRGRHPVR
jgi:hypothetical protein